ncbi:MAG: zinc-ribbon domain containing protein [Vulcanibacillus sp.]
MYKDKELTCKECGKGFVFSASEQEFYAEKGFTNEPVRCPECRSARKSQQRPNNRGGGGFNKRPQTRTMYPVICDSCGVSTTVPFQPSGDKPVYCKDCFQSHNN